MYNLSMAALSEILDLVRQRRQRLAQLQQEVAQIQEELRQIEDAAKGRTVPATKPKPKSRHGFTGGKRARPIQERSSVGRTVALLRQIGRPITADEIVMLLNAQGGEEVKKPTLVSNLSRYVAHNDTFTRPAPNPFGLIEFDESQPAETSEEYGSFTDFSAG